MLLSDNGAPGGAYQQRHRRDTATAPSVAARLGLQSR